MIAQSINLNLIPGGVLQHIRVSQYDVGSRTLTFVLYNGTQKFTMAGVSAQIRGTKPDKHGFEYSATYNNGVVTCDIEQQMTIVAGEVECELILTLNSQVLGTANFILDVEKAALGNDTDISETEIPDIIDLAESHALVAEGYALGKQNGTNVGSSSPYYHNNSKYYKEQAATSATNAANSATAAAGSAAHADATAADVDEAVQAVEGVVDTTYGMQDSLSIDVDGNPIEGNFAAGVADKLIVDIKPIQDLHGYDEPWVGGAGKNKCPYDKIALNPSQYFTLASGSYTFSFRRLGSPKYSTSKILLKDSDNNNIVSVSFTGSSTGQYLRGTFTLTETTSCRVMNENVNVDSSGYAIDNIQIEIGNERTTYEPYSNECSISGVSELNIGKEGKNKVSIFDNITSNTSVYAQADGSALCVGKTNGTTRLNRIATQLLPAGSYIVSGSTGGADGSYGLRVVNGSTSSGDLIVNAYNGEAAFTLTEATTISLVARFSGSYSSYFNVVMYPMIRPAGTSSVFEPYKAPTNDIIDLDDTRYGVTINTKNGIMKVEYGFAEFDGSNDENWTVSSSYDWNVYISKSDALPTTNVNTQNIANLLPRVTTQTEEARRGRFWVSDAGNLNVGIYDKGGGTLEGWRAFLASKPLQVCYHLKNVITVQLDPATVELFKGYNKITANGNTVMHLSAVPEKLINYIVNAFGTDESGRTTASRAYAAKEYFYKDGKMYKVTTAIAQGAAFTVGTNCVQTTIFAELTALNA